MVRLGRTLWSVMILQNKNIWKMGTLKSVISQIRTISAGESDMARNFYREAQKVAVKQFPLADISEIGEYWIYKRKQRF
jgi:hypothetical protein